MGRGKTENKSCTKFNHILLIKIYSCLKWCYKINVSKFKRGFGSNLMLSQIK